MVDFAKDSSDTSLHGVFSSFRSLQIGMSDLRLHSRTLCQLVPIALAAACTALGAQEPPSQVPQQIIITGTPRQAVEKSYRKMIQGMDGFERARAAIAPDAALRFKLLPRKPGTDMNRIVLEVIGSTFDYAVQIAPDHTFVLQRNVNAMEEDAVVTTNRRRLSMTWRTEIRTPGLPPHMRRLGDLRLECEVGLEAGLVSNNSTIGRIYDIFRDSKSYCDRKDAMYLYFAERPIFSVTLVAGARQEVLPIDRLYAMASDDPGLKQDLPYCDCEMLVDRAYFLPLGDHSWPDDTLVKFDFMDDRP